MMNNFKFSMFALGLILSSLAFSESRSVLDLNWEDLVPKNSIVQNPIELLSKEEAYALTDDEYQELVSQYEKDLQQAMATAPVVEDLNGKTVSLSGYAVPLDFEAETVYEMLLVPYFGACIHVPPPPGNQTVYIQFEEGTKLETLWDAINVTGKISTTKFTSDLADASYAIEANEIKPYQDTLNQDTLYQDQDTSYQDQDALNQDALPN